jgi:hypothetical protein
VEIGELQERFEVWVPFQEDAAVLIKYVPLEELRTINKKVTSRGWDRKHRPEETTDTAEANRLLGRAAVKDWKGFTMKGAEYPYSPEHCDFLMTNWLEFSKFVNDVSIDLRALQEAEAEARAKNSGPTSGQKEISQA